MRCEGVDDFVTRVSGATELVEESRGESWRAEIWYYDICRYLTEGGVVPIGLDILGRKLFKVKADHIRVVDGDFFRLSRSGHHLIPCIRKQDVRNILKDAHDSFGHFASAQVARKFEEAGGR